MRLWGGRIPAARFDGELREAAERPSGRLGHDAAPVLVTGGAGFVGTNLALRLAEAGHRVIVFDNLSRAGVERNAQRLSEAHPGLIQVVAGDVRDRSRLEPWVRRSQAVFHLAGQVAVTRSLTDPVEDFEINLRGTLNVLESQRACARPPALLFTSTNKVYGRLPDVPLKRRGQRYWPRDRAVASRGVAERALSCESPYGCSKGGADQYVLDYARSYGLANVVFRMSCIFGPHQQGTEDQGWVAHFLQRALTDQTITIYGDGRQVRDVLFVEDLIDAMILAMRHPARTAGRAFNIGGGVERAMSLIEMLKRIETLVGEPVRYQSGNWRQGDQRYYVTDWRAFEEATGWRPRAGIDEGLKALHEYLRGRRGDQAGAAAEEVSGAEALNQSE